MKKHFIYTIVGLVASVPCIAANIKKVGSDDNTNHLISEIRTLENQLEQKNEILNKCASKNKNFQVAGIATVGLAGIGIATNVSLYSKMKEQIKQSESMKNKIQDADISWQNFSTEIDTLSRNIDKNCYNLWFNNELNDSEQMRFTELYNNRSNLDEFYSFDLDNIPESDKVIFEKMVRGMRKCQKE